MKSVLDIFGSIIRSIASVFRFILGLPKGWFAAAYFGFIPLFALFYWLLPGAFYHSNVAREPGVIEDEKRIGNQLQQEIIRTFKAWHESHQANNGDWSINADSFQVRSLKTDGEEVSFRLDLKLTHLKSRQSFSTATTVKFPVKGGAESVSASELEDEGKVPRYKTATVNIPPFPVNGLDEQWSFRLAKELFPAENPNAIESEQVSPGRTAVPAQEIYLPIPRSLDRQILNLARGIEGDPSELSGHFRRMLYLSAVTITTLGYGDVAPLTGPARALITTEAISGIMLIGLFLNALAGEQARKK